jgi:hypothetical protein
VASWLTLYALTPADGLTAAVLHKELDVLDWDLLVEISEFPEGVADTLCPRYLTPGEAGGFDGELQYAEGRRPIVIHRWRDPERVAEERAEALEEREVPDEARRYVTEAVEVIALEMGWSVYETGGIVVAWEVARLLASYCKAAVTDDDERWFVLDGHWTWRQLHPDGRSGTEQGRI